MFKKQEPLEAWYFLRNSQENEESEKQLDTTRYYLYEETFDELVKEKVKSEAISLDIIVEQTEVKNLETKNLEAESVKEESIITKENIKTLVQVKTLLWQHGCGPKAPQQDLHTRAQFQDLHFAVGTILDKLYHEMGKEIKDVL